MSEQQKSGGNVVFGLHLLLSLLTLFSAELMIHRKDFYEACFSINSCLMHL